jgi:hypothetical protein
VLGIRRSLFLFGLGWCLPISPLSSLTFGVNIRQISPLFWHLSGARSVRAVRLKPPVIY